MTISYDYYRIFYYVATYHSFNRAAAVLSNSQPNISRSISNLEAQLNCKLFRRSSTGVTLTEAGEKLFVHVEAAFRHLTAGEDTLAAATDLKQDSLTIGISIGLTQRTVSDMIIPVIHAFHDAYPGVRLKILHASSLSLMSEVRDNLMDAAFVTSPVNYTAGKKDYHWKPLFSYQDIVIAGKKFRSLAGREVHLVELMDYPIVSLGSGTETYEYYKTFFADHGLEFSPAVETTSTGQTLIYTIENLGVGMIHPRDAAQSLREKSVFKVRLKEKPPKRHVAMIRSNMEKKAAVLLEQMMETAEDREIR
ncbi:MAG: LysR family transcriptional regulator [Lachnospiraceae bacterium]|nr:LysR family transcriptional regulator [Lachnospiraceae bacterium]